MLIFLVRRAGTQKRKGQLLAARLCVDSSIPREEGQGGQARAEGDKRKEFSIPGLAKYEGPLSLAQARSFSFHHPLCEPRVSREKLKRRKG